MAIILFNLEGSFAHCRKTLKLKLMGAKLAEVPFILKYDLKGPSKMPFNVTTFGYMIMVILYHWLFRLEGLDKTKSKIESIHYYANRPRRDARFRA